jgi:hypothetical protein
MNVSLSWIFSQKPKINQIFNIKKRTKNKKKLFFIYLFSEKAKPPRAIAVGYFKIL